MVASVNASTTSGVVVTSDLSGQLALQSNGTTVATVTSAGLNLPSNNTLNTSNTFGFKNRLINGAMTIAQYGTSAVSATALNARSYTCCDRWHYQTTVASKYTLQQSTTAPAGFINSLLVTSSSAYTPATGDVLSIGQVIEGLNISDLGWGTSNGKTVTLSFWVQSSLTGNFGGCLINNGVNSSYPFLYNIATANTWTPISITIPAPPSGTTWLTTNGGGVYLFLSMGAGTTYAGTSGVWGTTNCQAATGNVNLVATSGATFYITGVQFEVGSQATSFDFRDYGREQLLCYRYYYQSLPLNSSGTAAVGILLMGGTESTSLCAIGSILPVTMRTAPSFTLANANIYTFNQNIGPANITLNTNRCSASHAGASMNNTAGGWTGGQPAYAYNSGTNSYFAVNAEL